METTEKITTQPAETARKIVDRYLELFPRKLLYGVNLESSEDDSELTIYHPLTEEEKAIIQKCAAIAKEEDLTFDEVLSDENEELYDRLVENDSVFSLNIIGSIDLDNPLKFTKFSYQPLKEDGSLSYKQNIGAPLTDEEYTELLTELLLSSNHYSMNMLTYRKPELCQKIIQHLTYSSMNWVFEDWHPAVIDLSELKDICKQILDPFTDILHIFHSDDEAIAQFALRHQIVPEDDNEIYATHDESGIFHCIMNFHGTKLVFYQRFFNHSTEEYHDEDSFKIEAKELMEKFSLKTPQEILPYLKEHYNTRDCLTRIKKEFEK